MLQYRFIVAPSHFVVAREHAKSSAWHDAHGRGSSDGLQKAVIANIYRMFKNHLKHQCFDSAVQSSDSSQLQWCLLLSALSMESAQPRCSVEAFDLLMQAHPQTIH